MDEYKSYELDNFDVIDESDRDHNYEIYSDSQSTNYKRTPQHKRRMKKRTRNRIAICTTATVILLAVVIGLVGLIKAVFTSDVKVSDKNNTNISGENNPKAIKAGAVSKAKTSAAQYDYETAIAEVKAMADYSTDSELQALVTQWEQEQANLVEFPHEEITHVFFHSLVCEPELAFDPSKGNRSAGYNLVMTTVDEFNEIIETMYNKGYVMVSMHDICTFDEQGNRVDHKIMLPEGKKAFVLSQDDLNYYHVQDGDGIPTKLIFDENGKVKTEYKKLDGTTTVGDFDVVPIIDSFVEKHPDFAYKGHKGIIALTGYNGILGYRTDSVYKTHQDLDPDQVQFLEANPDFNYEQDVADAKKIADAMKATGWEFATHTWGHISVPSMSMEKLQTDHGKWKSYVESIVGPTDVMIYPNGSDVAGVENYTFDNERFSYLYEQGIRIFCPVDSARCWQQKGDNYFRMGRRNLDGYRMYHDPELLEDLFDASKVIDPKRPTPVPTMEEVYG